MAIPAIIKIKLRTGVLSLWQSANPVLLDGELGFVSDAGKMVIGDGVTAFNSLTNLYVIPSLQLIVTNYFLPLSIALGNESTTRLSNDNILGQDIQNEATARVTADNNLSVSISNVSGSVTTEVSARIAGDSALQTQIDAIMDLINNALISVFASNSYIVPSIAGLASSTVQDALAELLAMIGGGGAVDASAVTYADPFLITINGNVEEALDAVIQIASLATSDIAYHANRTDNPHLTTKVHVGLGNADNTSDVNKPVSTAQAAADAIIAGNLATEITNRTTADSTLQTNIDAKVIDSIADADTTHAPSRNAVFDALALKANLASPTFTGTVIVPDQSAGDNSTKAANTGFVTNAISDRLTFAKAYSLTTLGI